MKDLYYYFLFALILNGFNGFAQSPDSMAQFHFGQLQTFIQQKQWDSAQVYGNQALTLYADLLEKSTDSLQQLNYVKCLAQMGRVHFYQKALKKARYYFNQSLSKAQSFFDSSHYQIAYCHMLIGEFYYSTGQYPLTIEHYQKSIPIIEKQQPLPVQDLAYRYGALGSTLRLEQKIDQAILAHLKALDLRLTYLPESHPYVAYHYHQLGMCYSDAFKLELAEKHFLKALEIRRALYGDNHPQIAMIYNDLGVVYWRFDELNKALSYYQKALAIYEKNYEPDHLQIGYSLNNIGLVYNTKGEFDKGLVHCMKALEIKQKRLGNQHKDHIRALNNVALCYLNLEQYELSQQYAAQAIYHNTGGYDITKDLASDWLKAPAIHPGLLENSLSYYAYNYVSKPSPGLEDLYTAKQVNTIVQKMKDRHLKDRHNPYELTNKLQDTYSYLASALRNQYFLFQETDSLLFIESAYQLFEQSRAVMLGQAVRGGNLSNVSGIPYALLEQLQANRSDRIFYEQQQLNLSLDSTQQERWRKTLYDLGQETDSLVEILQQSYPAYYTLCYEPRLKDIYTIQNQLKENECMLLLMEGDRMKQEIFALQISRAQIKLHRHAGSSNFSNEIVGFRNFISQPDLNKDILQEYQEKAYALYTLFLKEPLGDLPPEINHLILVPNEFMHYVPFELLLTQAPDSTLSSYRDLPYLLNDFTIQYAPTASLWLDLKEQKAKNQQLYAGFAPDYGPQDLLAQNEALRGGELASLTGNLKEVQRAQEFFGGESYLGDHATKAEFLNMDYSPAILHLAMHAEIQDHNPMQSKFLFTQTDSLPQHQALYAYEIYGMNIQSQLAVLSACETGLGQKLKGEGLMSLSRAFMYAGCPSIITSLWKANDKYTANLMESFFAEIKKGSSKATALRKAKLSYLQQTDEVGAHPANWGTFILIGNNAPISRSNPIWIWLTGSMILLLVVGFGWSKRKEKNS